MPPKPPSREEELARIRGEIDRLHTEIAGLQARESGAAGALERTELELRLQEERLAEAAAAHELAEQRVAEVEAEVARLTENLAAVRRDLRRRLVGLYRLGRHGYLRLALVMKPGDDLLAAVRLLRFLVRRDADTFARFVATREELGDRRQALLAERQEAEAWVTREAERRRELATALARQTTAIERLVAERRSLAGRAAALTDREQKLAAFIDFLFGAHGNPVSGVPIQDFRGVLDWPVAGRVTVGFGPRRDPRYQHPGAPQRGRDRHHGGRPGARRLPGAGALRLAVPGLRADRRPPPPGAGLHPLRRARRPLGGAGRYGIVGRCRRLRRGLALLRDPRREPAGKPARLAEIAGNHTTS